MANLWKLTAPFACVLLLTSVRARADRLERPPARPTVAMASQADAVEQIVEECRTHPAVTHAGTPLEVCMDSYGYVREGTKWVKKPLHR